MAFLSWNEIEYIAWQRRYMIQPYRGLFPHMGPVLANMISIMEPGFILPVGVNISVPQIQAVNDVHQAAASL